MKVFIQRNQIRYYKDQPVLDEFGNPTGETMDTLQLGVRFVEYPDLPTYGISVNVTGISTQAELRAILKAEILSLVDRVGQQIVDDESTRQYFDNWGWSGTEFETDNL